MSARAARDPQSGLTLVEMLVTLAIVAAMAGAVMAAGLGGRDAAAAESEARRIADRLRLAVDRSLVGGIAVQLDWSASGYTFVPDGAEPVHRALPGALRLVEPGRAVIGAGGYSGAFTLSIEGGGRLWRVDFDGINARVSGAEAP